MRLFAYSVTCMSVAPAVLSILILGACASLPQPGAQQSSRADSMAMASPGGSSFSLTALLGGDDTRRIDGDGTTSEPRSGASGSLRFTIRADDVFEYQLILTGGGSTIFVAAYLERLDSDTLREPVLTLFRDVTLEGRYAQMRGTGTTGRAIRASELMAELRANPGHFIVRIAPRSGQPGELRGVLR